MSPGWVFTLLALLPLAAWGIGLAVVAARRWWRRRGDERTRRLRLARMLATGDLVVVPTADVDLPERAVLEVAAEAGVRLVGYERTDSPLPRRVGVFVRIGSEVDAVIRGDRAASGVGGVRAPR